MLNGQIAHSYLENSCTLVIPHPRAREQRLKSPQPAAAAAAASSSAAGEGLGAGVGAGAGEGDEGIVGGGTETEALHVDRIRNCDIFVDAHDLYFYADFKLYKFHSRRTFDLRELKNLLIRFNPTENHYQICLRCLPLTAGSQEGLVVGAGGGTGDAAKPKSVRKEYIATFLQFSTLADATAHMPDKEPLVQEWKLKRITDQCQLQLDGHERTYKLTNHFGYGFASKYSSPLDTSELDRATCRVADPHRMSPIQRRQERVVDEMKRFSREQYKMNFVELQVPSGHQNPLHYKPKIYETSMTQEQAQLLHNLSRERAPAELDSLRQSEIDCGLISILLAICYDVRTTNNEPTCESSWTRSILCPLFCYFEQFDNYRDVLVAFLRRVVTYPLYRNFDLGRQCVRDAIDVLKGSRNWLIYQLLLTHQQFACSDPSRDNFNTYYLEDYIRYVTSAGACSDEHLRLLARNLKNVQMDVSKRHLGLGVTEIETELIKELVQEMRIEAGGQGSSLRHHLGHGDDDLDQDDETTTDDDSVITDSFDSMDMDMRLIENEIVYAVDENDDEDEEDEDDEDDEDEDEDEEGADEDEEDDSSSSTTSSSEAEGNSVIEQCSNSEAVASSSTK
ncbi:hypothetical protein KR009_009642 [Drosophila setifemur]|nr:hypothetical protein KR009_009642 [Drosophila setifemur]